MLKIKAPGYATDLYLILGPLLASMGVGMLAIAVLCLNLHGERFVDGLAYILAALSLLTIVQGVSVFRSSTRPGNTRIALYANDRTLAIVRYRAPVRYLKRSNCTRIDQTGFGLCRKDGTVEYLGSMEFGGMRLQKEFLVPLYAQWCPRYSKTEIRHYLDTRSKWKLSFTPYFFSGSVLILLMGFTTAGIPPVIVFGLATTPWLTFYACSCFFKFKWRNHPAPPDQIEIDRPHDVAPPLPDSHAEPCASLD